MRRGYVLAVAVAVLFGTTFAAQGQTYPEHPITLVVPFSAGSVTDVLGRLLAERMQAILGQPVVVEDVPGAAGTIALGKVLREPADGYTLSIGNSTTHMLTGGLYHLKFDLLKDLDPIVKIGDEPLLVVTREDLPVSSLTKLIAWLKRNPGRAAVGIAGLGTTGQLAALAFEKETDTTFAFMPYSGNAPARQALVAGQIDFMIEPSSDVQALVKAGTIKALAVTSAERVDSYPDTPTAIEAGLPDFTASLWYGLWVRHGTPEIIEYKLNEAMRETLADPDIAERMATLGIRITPKADQTPERLKTLQTQEAARWWPIIKAANIGQH